MAPPDRFNDTLAGLSAVLALAPTPPPEDLYLERTLERWWQTRNGQVVEHGAGRRDGVAVRRQGRLESSDATDRATLARLLRVAPRLVPPVPLPSPPPPPQPRPWVDRLPPGDWTLRWRWRWAAVVRHDTAVVLPRPELLEVHGGDGQRALAVLPMAEDWHPPAPFLEARGTPPRGRPLLLLAPAAAAALIHEVVGHTLEGDLLVAGRSPLMTSSHPWRFQLALDVYDDPTRVDLPGFFTCDDEGTPATPRALLRGGEVTSALADRANAPRLGVPAGNARRASAHALPRPRMSNLITRGPATPLPALRQEARLEVTAVSAASLDLPSTRVRLQVRTSHALRRGNFDRPLPPFILHAPLADVCQGILACSANFASTAEPGWCRKDGDAVPVGSDTPWLLLQGLEVG